MKEITSIIGPKRDMVEGLAKDIEMPDGSSANVAVLVNEINRSYSLEFVVSEVGKNVDGPALVIRDEIEKIVKRTNARGRVFYSDAKNVETGINPKKEIPEIISKNMGDLANSRIRI